MRIVLVSRGEMGISNHQNFDGPRKVLRELINVQLKTLIGIHLKREGGLKDVMENDIQSDDKIYANSLSGRDRKQETVTSSIITYTQYWW